MLETIFYKAKKERQCFLNEQYEVINEQMMSTLNDADKPKLQKQLEILEKEIAKLDDDLRQIEQFSYHQTNKPELQRMHISKQITQLGLVCLLILTVIIITSLSPFFSKTREQFSYQNYTQSTLKTMESTNKFVNTSKTQSSKETTTVISYTQEIDRELLTVWKNAQAALTKDIPQDVKIIEQQETYIILVAKAFANTTIEVPWQISSKRNCLEKIALYIPELFTSLKTAEYYFVRGKIENADLNSEERSVIIWFRVDLEKE